MRVVVAGVHLPREEGRGHCCAEWPQQDGQLCLLEPGLSSGASSTNILHFAFVLILLSAICICICIDLALGQVLASASDDNTVRVWGPAFHHRWANKIFSLGHHSCTK